MIKSRISNLTLAFLILPLLTLVSCRDSPSTDPSETIKTRAIEPREILPLQISMQGLGQFTPVATRIEVDANQIQVEILNESKSVHLSKFPLDEERFRSALSTLQPDDFHQEKSSAKITEGIKYTLQTPLGTRTISLDSASPETLVPESAAPFKPLVELIDEWNKEAGEEWKAAFVAKATRRRNIVEPILNFIEIGMTREEILTTFPDPDITTQTLMSYENWDPAVVQNAGRKGIFAININFEDGIVTGWSISSSG